eukprot:TRINITY_DN2940_c0_g1_i1.p1 TRINITY_DN2940_c0_g1~~TRINITY_DN2940_c0_g1_i1.p1  ORF type:complete len:150 (+),score=36.94 TRINITY_DN2940_c0_g1_i1:61-450(+)
MCIRDSYYAGRIAYVIIFAVGLLLSLFLLFQAVIDNKIFAIKVDSGTRALAINSVDTEKSDEEPRPPVVRAGSNGDPDNFDIAPRRPQDRRRRGRLDDDEPDSGQPRRSPTGGLDEEGSPLIARARPRY